MSISTLAQATNQINRSVQLQTSLQDLQYQLSSGKVSASFSGLKTNETLHSIRSRDIITGIETYQQNITLGNIKIDVAKRSVQEAIAQTVGLSGTMMNELQQGEIDIDHVVDYAQSLRQRMESIVNVKDQNQYLFAGADASVKPFSNHGTMDSFSSTQVQSWIDGTITTDQLVANYKGVNESTVGFSAPLAADTTGNVTIRASETSDQDYTVLADEAGFKEIIATLSMIESLAVLDKVSLDTGDDPLLTETAPGATASDQQDNFFNLFNTMIKELEGSIGKLRDSERKYDLAQLNLHAVKKVHVEDITFQENIVAGIEDSDLTRVAVEVNSLQVQLQASYSVMASMQKVSLVNYI